jgi:hypothetical protein|tara:strand:- start:66 stop:350 length:285 start_codon:yes stop_codon:yes gene_type:complete
MLGRCVGEGIEYISEGRGVISEVSGTRGGIERGAEYCQVAEYREVVEYDPTQNSSFAVANQRLHKSSIQSRGARGANARVPQNSRRRAESACGE